MISDTTIAATRTQNVAMRDEVIANFKIVFIPAILCTLFYLLPVFANGAVQDISHNIITISDYIKVLPYILLLILGILGVNVMFLLLIGTVLNISIGLYYSVFDIYQSFSIVGDGTVSMANTLIVAMLAGGLLQMVRYNGGINFIIDKACCWVKSKKSCEFSICFLTAIINLFTANNTVAILTVGGIAKQIGDRYGVDNKKCASILDTFSCTIQGMIPYGAQLLIAAGLAPCPIRRWREQNTICCLPLTLVRRN